MSTVWTTTQERQRAKKRPPGPRGIPLMGVSPTVGRDWLGFLEGSARQYGHIFSFRWLGLPFCHVSEPELVEKILVTGFGEFEKSVDYIVLKRMMGNGLLVSEGAFWQRQRRLMQPAFHRERIAAYGQVMVEFAKRRMATWREGDSRDIHSEMMSLTLEIVAKALFGMDASAEAKEFAETLDVFMEAFLTAGLYVLPAWVPTRSNLRMQRAIRRLDAVVYRIVAERRKSARDTGDLLSMLLAARDENGAGMTDQQVRDELMTLLMAGHETTANSLSWTFYLLAQHPEAEEKLVEEWRGVLDGRAPTMDDLRRLTYTEKVVRESLRLYPPAWGIGRKALREVMLGDYIVPAGTNIFLSQWLVHRDPRYFDDPEAFRPERWTPEMEQRLPRFAYFPFGGGPRVCIGASFAQQEAQLLLATIGQNWRQRLMPEPKVERLASITLRPKNGVPVRLERRHPQ